MSDTLEKEFWDRIEDINTGMMSANGARSVPMSHYVDEKGPRNVLWFITAQGTDLADSAASGAKAQYLISSDDEKLYARIDGTVGVSNDQEELDRVWNGVASAWFDGDKNDPDVRLVRFQLSEAEVWATGGNLRFLYEITKAHLTDEKPDMGKHGTLHFA
jgi:general stress protein 26